MLCCEMSQKGTLAIEISWDYETRKSPVQEAFFNVWGIVWRSSATQKKKGKMSQLFRSLTADVTHRR